MEDGTKYLHAGYSSKNAKPRVVPIVQSTTYAYDSTEEMAAVLDDPTKSLIYSRFGNPTVTAVEDKIAQLEGGIDVMRTTSGQAATLLSILNICNVDDSFTSTTEIYGGSVNSFSFTLKGLGIECIYTDKNASDEEIDKASQPNMKAVLGETITNLALTVLDTERLAEIAHRHSVPLVADNAFATPVLCKPFEYGADIVIHSTSKYMDGHAIQIGGCTVDSGNFGWTKGNFPDLTGPDESYRGISYTKTHGKKAYIVKIRMQLARDFGVYPAAHSAFLLNLGLGALAVRMEQYYENAMAVVRYLEKSSYVERVIYPGFENYEGYPLAQKYLKGCSGVTSFVIKGGKETAMRFMNALEFASNEVHVANTRTCILHLVSETHRQLTNEQLIAAGIGSGTVRLSVGPENIEDIITDLDKAFSAIECQLETLEKQR